MTTTPEVLAPDAATEVARDLREVADWLDAHPDYKVYGGSALYIHNVNTKEEAAALARAFGSCEKDYSGSQFYLKRRFGEVEVWAGLPREEVCRAVVTGTRVVAAMPAQPEHEEDVVEWVCDEALLA